MDEFDKIVASTFPLEEKPPGVTVNHTQCSFRKGYKRDAFGLVIRKPKTPVQTPRRKTCRSERFVESPTLDHDSGDLGTDMTMEGNKIKIILNNIQYSVYITIIFSIHYK